MIFELREAYKVIDLVDIAKIARSTYYYWAKQMKKPNKYSEIKQKVREIFNEHQGKYGYRRITMELRNQGYIINHKTVLRLMNQLELR